MKNLELKEDETQCLNKFYLLIQWRKLTDPLFLRLCPIKNKSGSYTIQNVILFAK